MELALVCVKFFNGEMKKHIFRLSLVVSCKGVLWILEKCLKALRAQSVPAEELETLFVFDSKPKRSAKSLAKRSKGEELSASISLIKSYFPDGKFIFLRQRSNKESDRESDRKSNRESNRESDKSPPPPPLYEMRNLGMRRASAPLIYFIDEDVILENPDHLSLLMEWHKKYPQYTTIGGAYLDSLDCSFWGKVYNQTTRLWVKKHPGYAPAGNLSVKKTKAFRARFVSRAPRGFGGEEIGFLKGLKDEGKVSLYLSEMDTEHCATHSLRSFIQRAWLHGISLAFEKRQKSRPVFSLLLFLKMKAPVGIKAGALVYLLIVRLSALIYRFKSKI